MTNTKPDPLVECERDGFPVLNINGESHCLAEFVDFCVGGQKVTDIVLRNETLYYVFENRHELPLLCYCCEKPLACPDLQAEKRQMRGRKLKAMTWDLQELEDGRCVIDYELEFSKRYGETEPCMVQTSTLSADKMVHPILCAHSGVSLLGSNVSHAIATPSSGKKRMRK
jgi:hypothetical protein